MDLSIYQQRIYENSEYIIYVVINFLLNNIFMPILEFVANHFLLTIILLFTMPFIVFPMIKGFMDFAYKLLGN